MKSKKFIALLVMGIFMAAGAAFAQEAPKAEEVKPAMDLSGVAYIWWQKDMDNEAGNKNVNHFSINRVYLTWAKQLNDVWSVRMTTDVDGSTTGADKVFFKNAYVQMKKNLDPVTLTIQYGLVGTPISGLIDSKSDYRWIHNNYFDASSKLLVDGTTIAAVPAGLTLDPTADMGILATLDIMKMVSITGLYSNGEGYAKGFNEGANDNSKAYTGVLNITPIKELNIAGYYKMLQNAAQLTGSYANDNELNMYGAMLIWSDATFKVGAHYAMAEQKAAEKTKYTLLDIWANINLNQFVGSPVLVVGRYAQGKSDFASSTGVSDVKSKAWEAGLGYAFNKYVRTLALYEVVDFKDVEKKDEKVWIKTEAKF